ncbi:Two pore potassium channel protein sup-9 [Melipona quadrifasciata]|uniref:Two pore potassium channel protein sup-9 n=1 Tax=Melipona quadrifasciata TaxID=166423 RepID=A0A0N1IT85_9HYME|nr:Two pore potassium channel protein sup-9 [Melipona quadrifasciata]
MPRSRQETFELMVEAERPSKCIKFLRFLWKFFRCVFSHVSLVSLVVLYCLIGAYAFEALEANHEKEIKKSIKDIRGNVAEQLWKITKEVEVLIRENWTDKALRELKSFENNLVWMMEKEGWDGSEGEDDIQWTFAGALFYSIVVITTIESIDIEDARAAKTGLLGWKTARRYEIPLYNARWSTRADKNFFVARIRRQHNGSTVRTVRSGVLWSKSYERSVVAEILEVLVHLVPVTEQTWFPTFFWPCSTQASLKSCWPIPVTHNSKSEFLTLWRKPKRALTWSNELSNERYGHISPKTKNGKVVTIFYAIVGIPLMLLCLSNIGDIMASSFRFLYWRVCCYICTKPPRKRRPRSHFVRSYSMRQPGWKKFTVNNSFLNCPLLVSTTLGTTDPDNNLFKKHVRQDICLIRRYGGSKGGLRRSIRVSQRSADSALGLSEILTRSSYFDVDNSYKTLAFVPLFLQSRYNARRYQDSEPKRPSSSCPSSINPNFGFKAATVSRYSDLPIAKPSTASPRITTQSLDRKLLMRSPNDTDRSAVLCNKYALDVLEIELRRWQVSAGNKNDWSTSDSRVKAEAAEIRENGEKQAPLTTRSLPRRCLSMEGATSNYRTNLAPPLRPSSIYLELENSRRSQVSKTRRYRTNYPIARSYRRDTLPADLTSSTGFPLHRQVYVDDFDSDYECYANDDQEKQPIKPVPIWLCVFLVVSYIFGGAFLFSAWEHWPFLDSAYFCFITLTTIGFGDFVPAYKLDAHKGIAVCSLYLLFGIALLAMSFNLVQEEVINNVKNVAKRLGIIKESDDEEDADDYDAYDVEYNDEVDNELEGYVLDDTPRSHSMARNVRGISVAILACSPINLSGTDRNTEIGIRQPFIREKSAGGGSSFEKRRPEAIAPSNLTGRFAFQRDA